jgi:excinuclease ABC subunit A
VIPNLQRRYRETESSLVREELARYIGHRRCSACQGARLNAAACNVRVGAYRLPELVEQPVAALRAQIAELDLVGWRAKVAEPILREIGERLGFLDNVGLGYLTLARSADSLSGGESQRIRLASQIGAGLAGVMYVLDEPSIGLHQRDNRRLLDTLGDCAIWAIP